MSRSQMRQAQQLIQQKKYAEARAILETIDHPTARKWLDEIDKRSPRTAGAGRSRGGCLGNVLGYLLALVISLVLTSVLIVGLVVATAPARSGITVTFAPDEPTAVAEASTAIVPARVGIVQSSASVNVRSGPSVTSDSIMTAMSGTQVEILGTSEDGDWYNVRLSDGREGWIAASLLQADPEPTSVAAVSTEAVDTPTTPTPDISCTTAEAQAWFDIHRLAVDRVRFGLFQMQNQFAGQVNINENVYLSLVRESREALNDADYPACVGSARALLLAGFQAFDNALQNTINEFPSAARSEFDLANQRIDEALAQLNDDQGVTTAYTTCGLEIWYAGINEQVSEFLNITGSITATTGPSEEIRSQIFDLQRLRREVVVEPVECALPAKSHLEQALDASIQLFQAIMADDTQNKARHLNTMITERSAFLNELQERGVPILGP